jgi:hypothetical protein
MMAGKEVLIDRVCLSWPVSTGLSNETVSVNFAKVEGEFRKKEQFFPFTLLLQFPPVKSCW